MLDRESPVPLYYQIAQELRRRIDVGALAPGDPLPTEEALQRAYGVSRATVRQAVRQLATAGLVRSSRPHGTFVTEPRFVEPLPSLLSFSEEVRRAGLTPATRVLAVAVEPPPPAAREHLRIEAVQHALRIGRLRLADGQPIAVVTSWLPLTLGITPGHDFSGSLYALLAAHGAGPARADQLLDAANATPGIAGLLQVPRRAALLVVTRITYDARDRPVEYVVGHYRADRYRFSVQLSVAATSSKAPAGQIMLQHGGAGRAS